MWALWRTGRRGRELDKAGVARRRSRPKRRRETMTVNRASARYEGLGKDGRGHIWTGRGALDGEPYGFASRFEDGPGRNPAELIAAGHAACFTMALSFALARAGHSAGAHDTRGEGSTHKGGERLAGD